MLSCEREPIHTPGAIQPHGALLAVARGTLRITHASANLGAFLEGTTRPVLGALLADVIGAAAANELLADLPEPGSGFETVSALAWPNGRQLTLRAFPAGTLIGIDIEVADGVALPALPALPTVMTQAVIQGFQEASTGTDLCRLAVAGLRKISGYDRVMAYRFAEDGHGEIVAECRAAGLTSYLGLHYPASDIPVQARRQYLTQRVGSIADAAYEPVPIAVDPLLEAPGPLDLTHSSLRSVSPLHREYMRNMQTAASLTIGLAQGGALWGMLVCHHTAPRLPGQELRAAAGLIGGVVSLLLSSLAESAVGAERQLRDASLRQAANQLAAPVALGEALRGAQAAILQSVDAAGAIARVAGQHACLGRTPPAVAARRALELLWARAGTEPLALDQLAHRFPELGECTSSGSGALLMPLPGGNSDDAILFFRPELARTVVWGGDPAAHMRVDADSGRLSPRTSFAAWKQTVSGHAKPWSEADLAMAVGLQEVFALEQARRTTLALRESEGRFALLAEHSGVVVTLNSLDGVLRYASPASERVLGWRAQDLVGRNAMDLVHPDDRHLLADAQAAVLNGTSERSACFRYGRPDGGWLWVEGHARLRRQADGTAANDYVVVLRDAGERRAAEMENAALLERMARMASVDGITGLANRRCFDEVAERAWRRCERDRSPLSLVLLDVDHFKPFNDLYGHQAGDVCLQAIAGVLGGMAQRPDDLAARYGGDEFLLLLPDTGAEAAMQLAHLLQAQAEALDIVHARNPGHTRVTLSAGVASAWPGRTDADGQGLPALLLEADRALYKAKGAGRNRSVMARSPGRELAVADAPAVAPGFGGLTGLDAQPMPVTESASTHESLMQFLYRAPVGLVQTALDGTVEMINPMSASLLMPLSRSGNLDNFFDALESVAPQLRQLAHAFADSSGSVCESVRVAAAYNTGAKAVERTLSISLMKLDANRLMAMVSDVTLEVEREQSGLDRRLRAAARIDVLTQMPNRSVVRDLLDKAIRRGADEADQEFAVLFLNCDRFKQINDALGHSAGDEVLGLMAERLRSTLRQTSRGGAGPSDEAAAGRIGGDEFVVLIGALRSTEDAHSVAQRLLSVLSQPYGVRSHQLHVSVSMGIVFRAQMTGDADAVLQDSSIAMREAKRAGGARYVVFEPAMHDRAMRRGAVEMELRQALADNQLFVVYQPVVALQPRQADPGVPFYAAGVEALVRWRHPQRGL
ncbi:MAG: diguanylate cyclase with sensor, partial [Rhodoferax sp.]|nr:diguanylate cyclase with sensor [Rhodoferax sp.]